MKQKLDTLYVVHSIPELPPIYRAFFLVYGELIEIIFYLEPLTNSPKNEKRRIITEIQKEFLDAEKSHKANLKEYTEWAKTYNNGNLEWDKVKLLSKAEGRACS